MSTARSNSTTTTTSTTSDNSTNRTTRTTRTTNTGTNTAVDRTSAAATRTNLVLLRGHLSSAPRARTLPSGSTLLQLEVTTPADGATSAASVPVVWFDPPAHSGVDVTAPVGTEVVVLGGVRRRFFRAGGATASRTEVVATAVVPTRRPRRVEQLVDSARSMLEAESA
mgnify:CR=1 FL=1